MVRWVLALLAVACAAPAETSAPEVWLPEGHPLYEAQQAWGMPLPFEPAVSADFGTREEVGIECGHPGRSPSGCYLPEQRRFVFAAGETPERLQVAKEHELGHLLSGRGDHIDCPSDRYGEHTMCALGRLTPGLTPEDFEFVVGE